MYEIVYSPRVQEKLAILKIKLAELCGEKKGKKRLLAVINGFETRLAFSNTGIPVKMMYDVEKEFEKYYILYSHKNYFFILY